MSELTKAIADLNKINDASEKTKQDGQTFEIGEAKVERVDWEIDLRDGRAWVSYSITFAGATSDYSENDLWVNAYTDFDRNDFDFEYEPDGAATYVPYGEQSVMYDDGKGSLDKVTAPDLDITAQFENYNGEKLDTETVIKNFKLTEEQAVEILKETASHANSFLRNEIEDTFINNPDYWPDTSGYDGFDD